MKKKGDSFYIRKRVPPRSVALSSAPLLESDSNQFLLDAEPHLPGSLLTLSQVSVLGERRLTDIKTVLHGLHSTHLTRLLRSQGSQRVNYVNKQLGPFGPSSNFGEIIGQAFYGVPNLTSDRLTTGLHPES